MELNFPRSMARMGALELGSKFIVESPLASGFVPVARPVRDDRLVSRDISRPQPHATDCIDSLAHGTQANPEVVLTQQEHIKAIEKWLWKSLDTLRDQARDVLLRRLMINGDVAA